MNVYLLPSRDFAAVGGRRRMNCVTDLSQNAVGIGSVVRCCRGCWIGRCSLGFLMGVVHESNLLLGMAGCGETGCHRRNSEIESYRLGSGLDCDPENGFANGPGPDLDLMADNSLAVRYQCR